MFPAPDVEMTGSQPVAEATKLFWEVQDADTPHTLSMAEYKM